MLEKPLNTFWRKTFAEGHPGGMKACSRGLRVATPTDSRHKKRNPAGVTATPHAFHAPLAHLRRAMAFSPLRGGVARASLNPRLQAAIPSGSVSFALIRVHSRLLFTI